MFAQNILATYTERHESLTARIHELEAALNAVREERAALEAETQQLQTLAGAGQSAIEQAANFLSLAERGGRGDMIESFWEAVDALRSRPAAELPEPTPPDDNNDGSESPMPMPPDDADDAVDAETEAVDAETEAVTETVDADVTDPDVAVDENDDDNSDSPSPQPTSVGSAARNYAEWSLQELKTEWDATGHDRTEVKHYGRLNVKQTWVDALNALNAM